ncbi:MAG TPA: nitroreductase family protein [bacterium]|nr:nitroreductase family protein [bacterium]
MPDRRVLDLIRRRRSIPKFTGEPVPRAVIEHMLEAATWAPNHHLTEPWQFFVLEDGAKVQFAELRRAFRLSLFPDPMSSAAHAAADKIFRQTVATPAIIVVTTRVSADPVLTEDDYAATMCALQNMLLAALDEGVGTYPRTGGLIHDARLRAFLDLPPDRRVAAIIYVGYPAVVPERQRAPWTEKTVWLSERRVLKDPVPAAADARGDAREGIAIDPVCKMEVEMATAPATSVYRGTTYYFCAPGCKATFDENPDAYAS